MIVNMYKQLGLPERDALQAAQIDIDKVKA